jgi:tetratricopeptide (TPR) repeat protein
MKRITTPVLVLLAFIGLCALVYVRLFSAGFVGFDDEIHVYANPHINPPTLHGVATLWQQSYKRLYIPLAYTIFAAIARFARVPAHLDQTLGDTISVDPGTFHLASVAFHVANCLLCFWLIHRLTRRRATALIVSLVFAFHPLQVESVGWISELRGLASAFFALLALFALVLSRQAREGTTVKSRAMLTVSALLVMAAMLCKPSAAPLPLIALVIDLALLGTSRRRAIASAALWAMCVLPFALITHWVQAVDASATSAWWQRPLVAGDSLVFTLGKIVAPFDLCVDYGRTPEVVLAQTWGYLAWIVPAALLAFAYRMRTRRPLIWLGTLLFIGFLLPTLGLVPFTYQAHSTVADRYAYLALVGIGLILADIVDILQPRRWALGALSLAFVVLALLSFRQSHHWTSNGEFLRHTIAVNPKAAFAYHNLGRAEQATGDYPAALADYQSCLKLEPTLLRAYVHVAEVYFQLGRPADARRTLAESQRAAGLSLDKMTATDFSNLGFMLMQTQEVARAAQAFSAAASLEPTSSEYHYNEANALSMLGQFEQAESAFRRCIRLAPTLVGAHTGLGIVLAEKNRMAEAAEEFRAALRLDPKDPAAQNNLRRAESMLEGRAATTGSY